MESKLKPLLIFTAFIGGILIFNIIFDVRIRSWTFSWLTPINSSAPFVSDKDTEIKKREAALHGFENTISDTEKYKLVLTSYGISISLANDYGYIDNTSIDAVTKAIMSGAITDCEGLENFRTFYTQGKDTDNQTRRDLLKAAENIKCIR